jgi:hypothetical protein
VTFLLQVAVEMARVRSIMNVCVSRLENCNISGVECGKIRVFEKPSRISIAFSM